MKRFKILSVLLAFVLSMCLALAACGGGNAAGGDNDGDNNAQTDGGTKNGSDNGSANGQGGNTNAPSGDVLIVYFSATNNTEKIAGYIADITGATQFELVPVNPYSSADLRYGSSDSRVSKEHADEALRDIELEKYTPDNWDSYKIVFVGYPIWWGIAAWPVNGFIKNNDFTGKTVIPFCTSASSGLGESGANLAQMAGTGNWKDGKRFSSSASQSDVEDWIESFD